MVNVFDRGENVCEVTFTINGMGDMWDNADCRLTSQEAEAKFDMSAPGYGYALIRIGDNGFEDSADWVLESFFAAYIPDMID